MTTLDDFRPALDCITELLAKYHPKHGDAWRNHPIEYHLHHAAVHLHAAQNNRRMNDEDLISAVTRLCMALTLREEAEAKPTTAKAVGGERRQQGEG